MTSWIDQGLTPEISERLEGLGARDLESLAKVAIEKQQYIESTPRLPSKDAGPEELQKYRRAIGVPDEVEGYELPEGVQDWRSTAHETGLTPQQFAAVSGLMASNASDQAKAERERAEIVESWREKSKERFGENLDEIIASARKEAEGTFGEEDLKQLDELGLGNHPLVLETLAKAYESGRGKIVGESSAPYTSKQEAAVTLGKRIMEISSDPNFRNSRTLEYRSLHSEYMNKTRKLVEMGYEGVQDPRLGLDNTGFTF